MARIEEIKLHKATDWRAVAAELMKDMTAAQRDELIARHTPRSKASVTMHTRLSYNEAADYTRQQAKLMKQAEKAERAARKTDDEVDRVDLNWFTVSFFVKDWTLRDAETDEVVPCTKEGFGRADITEVMEVVELAGRVAEGRHPNA